jgi:lysine biosynthesis protein LysW
MVKTAECPDCQSSITLPPSSELWMRITCPECGTQLEIVDDNPWELDYAEDIDDDIYAEEADYEDFEEADDPDDERNKPWNT